MKEGERYVLTTGKASVIRDALSLVLAGVKSEGDLSSGTYQSLETFAKNNCDRLILDLRIAKALSGGLLPGIRNLRASHIGQVLVVTGEVTRPGILREIEAIHWAHRFPAHLASGLRSFVHLLF